MSVKISKIQNELLLVAAQRKDNCIATSRSLASSGVSAEISDLIARGFMAEVAAKNDALVWRADEDDGTAYGLKLTATGRKLAAELAIPLDVAEEGEQADAARNFKAVGRILKAHTQAGFEGRAADPAEARVRGTRDPEPAR